MRNAESRFGKSSWSGAAGVWICAAGLIATAIFGASSAPAAEYKHQTVVAEFGSDGTSATNLGFANNVAYQQASKRLYALSDGKIYGFGIPAPGTFTPLGGSFPLSIDRGGGDSDIAVDNSTAGPANNIYLAPDTAEVLGYDSSGAALPSGWPVNAGGETCGVSVDNEGHIWGSRYDISAVLEWNPSGGTFVSEFPRNASQEGSCKIAVDQSNNDIYISAYGFSGVYKYTKASSYTSSTKVIAATGNNNRLAINSAKKRLYVGSPESSGNILAIDTETGALLETINFGEPIRGLAVNEENDTLYVTGSTRNRVRELPGANVAKAITGEPTGNFSVSGIADLNGAGSITECYFEFGETTSYGEKQECAEVLPMGSEQAVSATLPGLEGEITYHYRLVVANSERGSQGAGADQTIVPHPIQDLSTGQPTDITQTGVTLHGSFTGSGGPQSYYFEWGATTAYGNTVGGPAGNGTGTIPVSESITGLSTYLPTSLPYHYRLVVTNSIGTTKGPDQTFLTAPPALPDISDTLVVDVVPTAATVSAKVNPNNGPTTYLIEYGPNGNYGSEMSNSQSIGSDDTPHFISLQLSGLTPGSTYHFRVVATNFSGTSNGPDRTFDTPDAPNLISSGASAIGQNSVRLNTTVAGNASPTSVYFEFGASGAYGQSTRLVPGGQSLIGEPISVDVLGLAPDTTYHFRVVATNGFGRRHGSDQTFKTLAASPEATGGKKQCRKGKVRRRGKCVRKPQKSKRRAQGRGNRNG